MYVNLVLFSQSRGPTPNQRNVPQGKYHGNGRNEVEFGEVVSYN